MGITVSEHGPSDYVLAPAGTFRAVCIGIVDMGTQVTEYSGQQSHKPKVLLTWEIDEAQENGNRFRVHRRFTKSLHEKASLRTVLQAWRGRAFSADELACFDLNNILGKPCMLSVVHVSRDGRTYANIASVSSMPKGVPGIEPSTAPIMFDLDEPDETLLASFSDRLQEQIKASPEWCAHVGIKSPTDAQASAKAADDDRLPF